MLNRANKLLIGKDIDRTAAVTSSTSFATVLANIVSGEVVVLDKNKLPLAAGSTVADSDTIFICQGLGTTFDYTNEAGTLTSGVRNVIFSDPIQGSLVKNYKAVAYDAKSEQTTVFTPTATIVEGTEYVLRIVYKDIHEHPGQFTQTYRVIGDATATVASLLDLLVPEINSHAGRRVNATDGTTTLTLTGREIPDCCTALTDIDEFSMVEFEAALNYIDSDGNWQTLTCSSVVTTPADYGQGNWEQIRDLEKAQLGYRGVGNLTQFPIITPTLNTTVDSYYDQIVIEHDRSYVSPDNQYVKQAPLTTVIALATASTGVNAYSQAANIVGILNTWMSSTPGAFEGITI